MTFATVEDFEARHGEVEEAQAEIVETLLGDASDLIVAEVEGSEAEWATDEEVDPPQTVTAVCVRVAYRAWSNPDALARSEIDDIAAWYRAMGPDALFLTDLERRALRRIAGLGGSFRATTLVSPYSGDEVSDLEFAEFQP